MMAPWMPRPTARVVGMACSAAKTVMGLNGVLGPVRSVMQAARAGLSIVRNGVAAVLSRNTRARFVGVTGLIAALAFL